MNTHLDFMRDKATTFPEVENPLEVRTMRIWHCKYKSLQSLSNFENLEELVIASFPDGSFDMLSSIIKLRYLSVLHLPKITDLGVLSSMENVESLSLSTSPSWDTSGKCTIVNSLEPVAMMKSLKHLELFGVCSADKSLRALEKCKNLLTARFSQYPEEEVKWFYQTTGVANTFNPKPTFEFNKVS